MDRNKPDPGAQLPPPVTAEPEGAEASADSLDGKELEAAVESILFASGEPVHVDRICVALSLDRPAVEQVLRRLMDYYSYERRGIRLVRMEDSWQLCSAPDYGGVVRKAFEIRKSAKLSQPALEALTIVAYYQPTTRAYVDKLRGVDSGYTMGLLLERGLIEECGRLQVPGRPHLYRTTQKFLRSFHLSSLDDLPPLPESGLEGQTRLPDGGLEQTAGGPEAQSTAHETNFPSPPKSVPERTDAPSDEPEPVPENTDEPSGEPEPVPEGTDEPSDEPENAPEGTDEPSDEPEDAPESTDEPSGEPEPVPENTDEPTDKPEAVPEGTDAPSDEPEDAPESTDEPSGEPEDAPEGTDEPSGEPEPVPEGTDEPTDEPEDALEGTDEPSGEPESPPESPEGPPVEAAEKPEGAAVKKNN